MALSTGSEIARKAYQDELYELSREKAEEELAIKEEEEYERLARYGLVPKKNKTYTSAGSGPKSSGSFPQSAAPFKVLSTLFPDNKVLAAILQTVMTRRSEGGAR